MVQRIHGDFNGLFGSLLCISHTDHAETETGETLLLAEGMELIAFERDMEEGKEVFLVARGRAVPSPPDLQCLGSTWCLKIDKGGVRHVSELNDA
ncbi:MAG: hypothetical protein OEQ18_16900 [Gammaproteobacteria bacterium]|nr:hypothetical protein [Gammaproteobacteria bacterium]